MRPFSDEDTSQSSGNACEEAETEDGNHANALFDGKMEAANNEDREAKNQEIEDGAKPAKR